MVLQLKKLFIVAGRQQTLWVSWLKFEPRVSNFPNHINHCSVAYMIATMKIFSVFELSR